MAARKESRIKTHHRQAIQVSMLLKQLQKHVDGKVEMSTTQLRAAEILLKKAIPDLKSTELIGEIQHRFPQEVGVLGKKPTDS